MHWLFVCLLAILHGVDGQDLLPGVTKAKCPKDKYDEPPSGGWKMTDFNYIVYDQKQPDGGTVTEAQVQFNIVGGWSNQSLHCEGHGEEFVQRYNGSLGRTRVCSAVDHRSTNGYNTTFLYDLERRELAIAERHTCGTDPNHMYAMSSSVFSLSHKNSC
jgi:hypothetical protein